MLVPNLNIWEPNRPKDRFFQSNDLYTSTIRCIFEERGEVTIWYLNVVELTIQDHLHDVNLQIDVSNQSN